MAMQQNYSIGLKTCCFKNRFGVCCLFLYSVTGSTINQNCSYLRNPGFPGVYSTTGSLSYTIAKISNGIFIPFQKIDQDWFIFISFLDVCFLRLDFELFSILGPQGTVELPATSPGSTCPDQFKVVVSIVIL